VFCCLAVFVSECLCVSVLVRLWVAVLMTLRYVGLLYSQLLHHESVVPHCHTGITFENNQHR